MALTHPPQVRPPVAGGSRASRPWLLVAVGALAIAAIAIIVAAVRHDSPSGSPTLGSGASVTVPREVAPFARVELAGTNRVTIHVGAPLSVAVTGDDNLVGRVTTVVRDGRLVVDDTGSFTTKAPMTVAISMPSLDGVGLSGTGTVTVDGVAGTDFTARLGGEGTVLVAGTVQRVTAVLAGDGTLDVHALVATDGTAQLLGTGTIRVHATSTLDATLTGTGTILYGGHPTLTLRNTGTGTVVPE